VANLRDQIADMRDEELDAWRDQAQRLAPPKPKPKPKPWWKRLRSTG
jgi:hypothetical protein